jgi:hypothetical protein
VTHAAVPSLTGCGGLMILIAAICAIILKIRALTRP